jgi:uncharacterized protein DUF4145
MLTGGVLANALLPSQSRRSRSRAQPDTPPDTADPTGICPRCSRSSNFKGVVPPIPLFFTGTQIGRPDHTVELEAAERVSGLLCLGCGQATAVVEEMWVGQRPWREGARTGGKIRWRGIHWWPPLAIAGITDAVPQPIRSCFEEGLRCLSPGAPRAAAVMFGRTLEAIVRDKGSEAAVTAMKKNLAAGPQVMADEHTITADLAEWAKEIRLARNAGGHFDPMDDVSTAEAENLSKLLRHLLVYLYEVGARIRRAKGAAPSQASSTP